MSQTHSATRTYSVADIEVVMRRVTADLIMIASSTGAVTEAKALDWAHDVELLTKNGYLKMVDLTLLNAGIEKKATRFEVSTTQSGELTMSRPGGVLWPRLANPELRIVLYHTAAYDTAAKEKMKGKLRVGWVPTSADTSHLTLKDCAGRDYVSNGYGMHRKDFGL
jgi:Bacterial HORMA domain family 1